MVHNIKAPNRPSRRDAITSMIGGGVLIGATACSKSETPSIDSKAALRHDFTAPDLIDELLVNRERASEMMRGAGVDAIICSRQENIYYLTNYYPTLGMMGMENLVYAILPANINKPPVLVIGQFEYYLAATQGATSNHVDIKLYTMPADPNAFAQDVAFKNSIEAEGYRDFLPRQHDPHPWGANITHKIEDTLKHSDELSATGQTALLKAMRELELPNKAIAIDSPVIATILKKAEIDVKMANGEQLLRKTRLQKSAAEIKIMEYAVRANAQAGLAAAQHARAGASLVEIRREFARECIDRYMTPKFMVVDSVVPHLGDGVIEEGRSFLIDCVSHNQYYHGDYGRTVCVGEPTGEIKRATAGIADVWDDLMPQLKPGMRYSEIAAKAEAIFKTTNSEATLVVNPHSVGLHHTDEPSVEGTEYYTKDDLVLVENMVLSVDLPMIDVGLGGSAHLEDLVVIGKDGARLLNNSDDRVIIV